jgi:hypothetical protein
VTAPQSPPQEPAPVASSEEYFNSSRTRVIAMIVAATVAVGALGGLAGVLFDPEPVAKNHVRQPARLGSLAGPGSAAPQALRVAPPFATWLPVTDGTATIEATGVDVFVPSGWTIDHQTANQVYLSNGDGSFAFAFSGTENPSTTAGDLIASALDDLLPPDVYTQRVTSDVQTLSPFGSVVSMAGLEYEALWVDNQGSISIHGQLYVGVRQDGTILGIEIEHVPAEEFPGAVEEMYPILDNSYGRFAGLG